MAGEQVRASVQRYIEFSRPVFTVLFFLLVATRPKLMSPFPISEEVIGAFDRIDGGGSPADLESETLDFKSERGGSTKTLRVVAKAAACLANGRGGTVVVGIEDDRSGPEAFSGTDLDQLRARRYIFETVEPPLTVAVDEYVHRDTRLLIIGVPVGAAVHGVGGRVTRRMGRSCLQLAPDHIAALHDEREGRDPSEQASRRSVDDLDGVALGLARRYLGRLTDERAGWVALSDRDLCRAIGVSTSDGDLLVAGEQLFCTPRSEFVSYQHRTTAGSPPDAGERLVLPLVSAFDRTLGHIAARNRWEALLLPDGQQLQLQRYPEDVVREALANAFVHRRLDLTGPVQVEHFDDSLTITSMGPLVDGVTVDNILTTASRPRNRLLARAFRHLGLIEELGTGVARMYRSMLRLGKPPPEFVESANSVRVSVVGGPAGKEFARFVALLDAPERNDVEVLLVLRHLCMNSSAGVGEIASLLQRRPTEAARTLERIAKAAAPLIEPVKAAASGHRIRYRLSENASSGLGSTVKHRRNTSREIERSVVEHVREHGRITNRVVRNLFGVGTPRASVILRNLVERRILERTSEARRGPSVEYGPGPLMTD